MSSKRLLKEPIKCISWSSLFILDTRNDTRHQISGRTNQGMRITWEKAEEAWSAAVFEAFRNAPYLQRSLRCPSL